MARISRGTSLALVFCALALVCDAATHELHRVRRTRSPGSRYDCPENLSGGGVLILGEEGVEFRSGYGSKSQYAAPSPPQAYNPLPVSYGPQPAYSSQPAPQTYVQVQPTYSSTVYQPPPQIQIQPLPEPQPQPQIQIQPAPQPQPQPQVQIQALPPPQVTYVPAPAVSYNPPPPVQVYQPAPSYQPPPPPPPPAYGSTVVYQTAPPKSSYRPARPEKPEIGEPCYVKDGKKTDGYGGGSSKSSYKTRPSESAEVGDYVKEGKKHSGYLRPAPRRPKPLPLYERPYFRPPMGYPGYGYDPMADAEYRMYGQGEPDCDCDDDDDEDDEMIYGGRPSLNRVSRHYNYQGGPPLGMYGSYRPYEREAVQPDETEERREPVYVVYRADEASPPPSQPPPEPRQPADLDSMIRRAMTVAEQQRAQESNALLRGPASSAEQPEDLWTLEQQAAGQPKAAEEAAPDQSTWVPAPASKPEAAKPEVPEDMEPPLTATENSRLGSLLPETTTGRA